MINIQHDGIVLGKFPEEVVVQGLRVGFFEPSDMALRPGAAAWISLNEMMPSAELPPENPYMLGDGPERFKELRETRMNRLKTRWGFEARLAREQSLSRKILYIEDSKPMALSVSYILKSHKFTVSHFELGKAALEAFHQCPMDWHAAIVDLGLPDMTGAAVITEFNKACPTMPIIVLSGASNIMDRLYLYTSGATAVLAKPCLGQDLIDMLNGLITLPPAPMVK